MKVIPSLVLALAAAAARGETIEEVEELSLGQDETVEVGAGVTRNVLRLTGGAYTLTKTGAGTLNIYWVANENARVDVQEGVFALRPYPKPTATFAKAHFHVDASDPASLELECVNGTNFVNRWNDTDGGTCYATNSPSTKSARTNPLARRPFLRRHFQNGLPVVDFGSLLTVGYTNENGVALGYGAALEWSEPMHKTFREGFTVFSDTDDIFDAERAAYAGHAMAPFAAALRTANYRTQLPNARMFENTTYSLPLGRGTNVFDLVRTLLPSDGYSASPGRGFHILNGITTAAYIGTSYEYYHVDSFAEQSAGTTATKSFGGQRIGEYAAFGAYLSETERRDISLYLKTKWFPRCLAAITIRAGAKLDAADAGLDCPVVREESGASASYGRMPVRLDPLLQPTAIIHLDATRADTMEIVSLNGTNFVTKWSDADGRVMSARDISGGSRLPFVNPDVTQNGLPFVDFGSLRTQYNTNSVGEALGYGAAMAFDSVLTAPEGITVVSDTPDVTDGTWVTCPDFTKMYGMSLFSTANSTWRGTRGKLREEGAPYVYANSGNNNPYSPNGVSILDGVVMTAPKSTAFPSGFHVFDSQPKQPETYGRWANLAAERAEGTIYSYGGQRIAEYLLFDSVLDDAERERVFGALRRKWFGLDNAPRIYATLDVSAGGAVELPYEDLSVTGRLTLGGRLKAPSIAAAKTTVDSPEAEVEGRVVLASGSTLAFRRQFDGTFTALKVSELALEGDCEIVLEANDWKGLGSRPIRIVSGPISGSGTFAVRCSDPDVVVQHEVDADGLTVAFPRGLMLIFR